MARVRLVGAEDAGADRRVELAAEHAVELAHLARREPDRAGDAHAGALGRRAGAVVERPGEVVLDELHLGVSAGGALGVAAALRLLELRAQVLEPPAGGGARRRL